jgi:hypothetical protein
MPVVHEHLSISQFAELLGIAPQRLNGLTVDKRSSRVTLVLEPEETSMSHDDIVPPPATFTVDHDHKARLYMADGRALVRSAGFTSASQTSGTFPQLTKGGTKIGGKAPKGKGGKKGC